MVEILLCAVSLEHGKNTGDYRMKVEDAIYHAVHDCEGGAASLAPRMGNLTASTLTHLDDRLSRAHHGFTLLHHGQHLAGDR
jgi:hypothetical protein